MCSEVGLTAPADGLAGGGGLPRSQLVREAGRGGGAGTAPRCLGAAPPAPGEVGHAAGSPGLELRGDVLPETQNQGHQLTGAVRLGSREEGPQVGARCWAGRGRRVWAQVRVTSPRAAAPGGQRMVKRSHRPACALARPSCSIGSADPLASRRERAPGSNDPAEAGPESRPLPEREPRVPAS